MLIWPNLGMVTDAKYISIWALYPASICPPKPLLDHRHIYCLIQVPPPHTFSWAAPDCNCPGSFQIEGWIARACVPGVVSQVISMPFKLGGTWWCRSCRDLEIRVPQKVASLSGDQINKGTWTVCVCGPCPGVLLHVGSPGHNLVCLSLGRLWLLLKSTLGLRGIYNLFLRKLQLHIVLIHVEL